MNYERSNSKKISKDYRINEYIKGGIRGAVVEGRMKIGQEVKIRDFKWIKNKK